MYEIFARTTFPYSAICYVQVTFPDGYLARGSGVVVGANDVLTAMHVIFDSQHGGYATSITVTPGADSSPYAAPYGAFTNWGLVNTRTTDWDQNGDGLLYAYEAQYDIALIGMRTRIGDQTGWLGLTPSSADFSGLMVGYPGAGTGMMAEAVYADSSSTYGVFEIDARLGAGASGGPLIKTQSGSSYVAGVLSSGNDYDGTSTYAALYSPGTWDWLMSVMASNDSLIPGSTPAPTNTEFGTAADDSFIFIGMDLTSAGLTISDPGGSDTFNAYLMDGNNIIDLNPGAVSTISGFGITIASGTTIEDVLSYDGDDWLYGNSAANVLWAEGGDDELTGRGGNDYLDGAAGLDLAVYSGSRSGYTISVAGSGFQVTDNIAGRDGRDDLFDVERLRFADSRVALDVEGNAGQAYRLYQAAFTRTPDQAGLGYQMNALDDGLGLAQVAQNFINSPEFAVRYGALNNSQFVTQLYANVLHRVPDVDGLAYHLGNLASGANTRADVLVGFSESPENKAAVIGAIQNGMTYLL